MSIHATSTKVYSGAQMLTKNGMATPSTDTAFWAQFSDLTQVDSGNGWATLTRSITNGYSNIQTSTTSVDLVGGNTYTAIVEIQNCSISSGQVVFAQTSAAPDPVSAYTIVNGCDYAGSTTMGANLNGNLTSKYNVYVFTTKSSFTRGLRYYIGQTTGAGSLDIRATILAGDHSSDWQDYCGDNYEPYVGSAPSPLIKGVAHVSTSKNLLNMQSGSNGEYFGTMYQDGHTWKNLLNVASQLTVTSSNIYLSIPITLASGTTVCVQCDSITTNSTTGCLIRFLNSSFQGVGEARLYPGTTLSQSTTLTGDAAYCYVYSSNNYASSQSATTTYTNLMVSIGSTAQPYEPYLSRGVYSGKNLFNSYTIPNYQLSDGTITVDSDGIISMSGNTRNNGYCRIYTSFSDFVPNLVAGQTYYIYVLNEFGSGSRNYIYLYGSDFFWNSGQPHTITQAELDANIVLYGGYQATTKLTIMVTTVSDTSYEPYVGGVPSPNPDYPQEIITGKLASKNLCPDTAEGYYVTSTSTGWGKTTVDSGVLIAVEPNTNYTISTTATQSRYRFCFATSLDDYSGYNGGVNDGGNKTYTKNSGSYPYLIVNATDLSKIQVEKGSTATEFEPYFTPIELARVSTYQDRVYKSGDDWYVQKNTNSLNMKDYKDKSWYISQYQGNSYVVKCQKTDLNIPDMMFDAGTQSPTSDICNYFTATPTSQLYFGTTSVGFGITTDGMYFSNNSWTVNDFKNFVDAHDVLVYYRKNTPTNTAITDSATIAWLDKYDTNALPHHKYVNTRRTTYVGASGLASAIDLYDGSYASALPTYSTANDHHLTTANGGTYTVSLQNISASIISGTVTFSVFTNQRKIDFSWNGSATSTNVSVSLQADEYIKSIYAYIPQNADAGITLSQQLESGSLTDFEPYYNIVKIYAGDDLVFEDTSLTD